MFLKPIEKLHEIFHVNILVLRGIEPKTFCMLGKCDTTYITERPSVTREQKLYTLLSFQPHHPVKH